MNNQLKYISTLLLLLVSFSFFSCDKDDDTVTEDLYDIIVNKPVVRLGVNEQTTVSIMLGNEGYSVKSYDTSIATASISGSTITVKSLNKQGATTVQVTDQEGAVGNITVAVGTFELESNRTDVEIERLETVSVIISSGNFSSNDELSYVIADPAIAELENTDPYRPYFNLVGKGIGTTTITFTDRVGKELTINVNIKPISIDTDIINKDEAQKVGINNKTVVNISKGNGGYTAVAGDADKVSLNVSGNALNIIGKEEGETTVTITDAEDQTYTFKVAVSKAGKVANITTENYFSVPFKTNNVVDASLQSLNTLTYEARFKIDNLNGDDNGNARINTIMGVEKIFLLRVDVHKGATTDRYIQLSADDKGSVRFEGSTKIETGNWYNVVVVLDPTKTGTDRLKLYLNGVQETLQLSQGTLDNLKEINLTSNFFIGQSDGKRRLNGAISYARIWTKALNASEISNYNGTFVDPSSTGLAAYWAFNNGSGDSVSKFISLTNNNFEATANSAISKWVADPILNN